MNVLLFAFLHIEKGFSSCLLCLGCIGKICRNLIKHALHDPHELSNGCGWLSSILALVQETKHSLTTISILKLPIHQHALERMLGFLDPHELSNGCGWLS